MLVTSDTHPIRAVAGQQAGIFDKHRDFEILERQVFARDTSRQICERTDWITQISCAVLIKWERLTQAQQRASDARPRVIDAGDVVLELEQARRHGRLPHPVHIWINELNLKAVRFAEIVVEHNHGLLEQGLVLVD